MITARPIAGYDARALLDASDDQRVAMMRQMGVMNADPPLPHSPCLKNIRTGVVLPWNELLAQQKDLVVCCDEEGNTDPEAWQPKVINSATPNDVLALIAQQQMFTPKSEYEHYTPPVKQNISPTEYDKLGVVPYTEVERLREKLHAGEQTDTGCVTGS